VSETATDFLLPPLDWLALLLCLAGALLGARSGLPRAFALLLWTLAALWLARHLSAHVAGWMPNSVDPADPDAAGRLERPAFALLVAVVLAVPVVGRLLGGAGGKKKQAGKEGQHRGFGAVAGLAIAVLLVTSALPFARGVGWLEAQWRRAAAPAAASAVAENAAWLYPPALREALRREL
jgi:uncharacterized membrane protein required for colicin V production